MYVLGIDVGGTSFKYGVVTLEGELVFSSSKKRLVKGNRELLVEIIKEVEKDYKILGVGFSLPGNPIDHKGWIETGGDLEEFFDFHIGEYIKSETGYDIAIENDAHSALLAEKFLGAGKDCENFLMITLGTGIGGASFTNGKLNNGIRNLGNEFHSLIIGYDENYTPKLWGDIASTINGLIRPVSKHLGIEPSEVNGKELYNSNDEVIQCIIDEFHKKVAIGAICLNNIFDVEKILVGGGISNNPDFIKGVNEAIDSIPNTFAKLHIEKCEFSNDAGVIGAAYKYLLKKGLK